MRHAWLVVLILSAVPAAAQKPEAHQWIRDLASASVDVRHAAATNLTGCAADCRAAVPALVALLERGEPEDRMDAAFAQHEIVTGEQEKARLARKPAAAASAADCGLVVPVLRPLLAGDDPAHAAPPPTFPLWSRSQPPPQTWGFERRRSGPSAQWVRPRPRPRQL